MVLGVTLLLWVGVGVYYFSSTRNFSNTQNSTPATLENTTIPTNFLPTTKEVRGTLQNQDGNALTLNVSSVRGIEKLKIGDEVPLQVNDATNYYKTDGTFNWTATKEDAKLNDEVIATVLMENNNFIVQELRIIRK